MTHSFEIRYFLVIFEISTFSRQRDPVTLIQLNQVYTEAHIAEKFFANNYGDRNKVSIQEL